MIKIKVIALGLMPAELNIKLLPLWKSDIFNISSESDAILILAIQMAW
jgi:hypothetical protein